MALTKVTYVDNVTVIGAANLNAIQDEIIANGNNISSLQSGKVDKDGKKVLSTNDFTNENLSKLNSIEPQATRVLVDSALSGLSTNAIQNKVVKDALAGQSQRIDNVSSSVADVYTPQAHSIGDYVTHDNKLYRAIVDIPTPEAWDETHWEEVNVADVVSELQEDTTEVNDIALSAYVTDTASGAIATLPDGADNVPIKNLSVAIEPVQDLHGYENPWPAGGGKNLFKTTLTSTTVSGVEFTVNSDGSVTMKGTATSAIGNVYFGARLLPAGSYKANGFSSGASSGNRLVFYNVTDSVTLATIYNNRDIGFTLENEKQVRVYPVIQAGSVDFTFYPMIRLATETDATFAPYSNICPISGHTECNVTRTGKNLFDCEMEQGMIASDTGINGQSANHIRSKNYIPVVNGQIYTLSRSVADQYVNFRLYDINKNYLGTSAISSFNGIDVSNTTQVMASGKTTCTFSFSKPVAYFRFSDFMGSLDTLYQLELGSTATSYEPYQGEVYDIIFPSSAGTVYGGNITVNRDGSGTLVVDMEERTFDGSETWWEESVGSEKHYFFTRIGGFNSVVGTGAGGKAFCNQYPSTATTASSSGVGFSIANSSARNQAQCGCRPINTANHTMETFKAMLAESPMQVCYELATPITIPLTAPQITTLLGTNNLWADCNGDVSVTYRADTALYIQKKIAEALA